jgi:hypothetical protein
MFGWSFDLCVSGGLLLQLIILRRTLRITHFGFIIN